MAQVYAEEAPTIAEPTGAFEEFTLRTILIAVRRRWWAVLPVFAVVVALGTWRTLHEPRRYQAGATVRYQPPQSPVGGAIGQTGAYPDYRVDRQVTEQQVIRSSNVAARAAQSLGLRLRVADPAIIRSAIMGDSLPAVDSAAPNGSYTLTLQPREYTLSDGSTVLARAPYGTPITARGIRMTVPAPPKIKQHTVPLAVVSLPEAIGEVQSGLNTHSIPQTDIIAIEYNSTDPLLASRIPNAVALAYADFSRETMRNQSATKSQFIGQRLHEQEVELNQAQDALKEFQLHNRLTDVAAEQAALGARIQAYETEERNAKLEQDTYSSLLGRLSQADTSDEQLRRLVSGAAAGSPNVKTLSERWFSLLSERQKLISQGGRTSQNQDVKAVDSLIARTKGDLQIASRVYLQELDSRLKSYSTNLAELRLELARYPELSADQARLLDRQKGLQRVYDDLLQQYQAAKIAQAVDGEVVRIIDAAGVPTWPVSPNRRRDFLMSVALGLFLGVGLAVLLEKLDDSVKSADDLRDQLGISILGMIPAIKIDRDEQASLGPAIERLVTHADPRSPVAESYRSLRTSLLFARTHQDLRTLVLTSPGPADGKSTTVANLAITFAQQGQRTLLIDADLRRAVLDKTFSVPRSPGLTDAIIGGATIAQAAHPTQVPNLFVMASGNFPPNPSELLGSNAMRKVLAEVREQFDIVLFDSPPLLAVTDAAVLSTMVDGTVLVVRMGSTATEAARRALAQLRAVHGRVLGFLMNDVNYKSSSYYGGYGYGYAYYSYYGSESNGNGNGNGGGVAGRLRGLVRRKGAGKPK